MKRIILHWTAGGHTPSNLDKEHYHFIVAGDGSVVKGKWPVEANRNPVKGQYAAHTLNCNTGSIGVSVAAMLGAVERPFDPGKAPIKPAQVEGLVKLVRDLCRGYGIPVTRETVLSHAEVQPTLGIKQRGKWDIAWLPGMDKPGDPVKVGDHLRGLIAGQALNTKPVVDHKPAIRETQKPSDAGGANRAEQTPQPGEVPASSAPVAKPATGFWAALLRALRAMFRKG